MFVSRFHFEYENIHLAIDSLTGELLELFTLDKNDNIIKNSMLDTVGTFALQCCIDGEDFTFSPPDSRAAIADATLRCTVNEELTPDGLRVTVSYPTLKSGDKVFPAEFTYTALLKGSEIEWSCRVGGNAALGLKRVAFPIINGVWFGSDWRAHTLYYPILGGQRIVNPVEALTEEPEIIDWRWQEYRYKYLLKGMPGGALEEIYPGALSMSWISVDSPSQSMYFGVHSPNAKPVAIRVGCMGKGNPGLCVGSAYPLNIEGREWTSPVTVTWLHSGDWHDGAQRYRSFRTPFLAKQKPSPEWLKSSAGLVAHYDFKYQNGGIVHRYKDIPTLAAEAKEMGYNHMLFAGWHKDGFDCGFPMYRYDEELGTEEELINGIRIAKEMGVHVTFYLNIRIHNRAYNTDTVDEMAIMNRDGTVDSVTFGNPDISFSVMCPGSEMWQELFCDAIRRVTEEYGADGVYLDQLSCNLELCYNPRHNHEFDSWSDNYNTILDRIATRYRQNCGGELFISGEWAGDSHGSFTDCSLLQTFFKHTVGAFPEMYIYTFPTHTVVDMLYPSKNLAMRPVHVAQASRKLMARLFCNGSYFWVYDLVDDNTFKRDPEGMKELEKISTLALLRKRLLPDAVYCDTDKIACAADGVTVSRFEGKDRDGLCIYASDEGEAFPLWCDLPYTKATQYFADGTASERRISYGNIELERKTSIVILE